jgi:hypothetical protein
VSDTPVPAGTATLVNLSAFVPASAPYASREVLALSVQSINGDTQAKATTGGGLHVVGYLGDIDGNGKLNDVDVTKLARYVAGFAPAGIIFGAWPDINPMLVADTSGDGRISSIDSALIASEIRGINRLEIPDVPQGVAPILGAPILSRPDPTLAPPIVTAPQPPVTNTNVDWNGSYQNFALTPPIVEPPKTPSWFDAPWAKDLAARLAEPSADGTPVTSSTLLRKLSRAVLRR